ncbi:MAG: patatin-like phospholipase family protein [Bacteroidota bacterium]|nr:patatin-like phospholipase family protein [Bacteroidota bacterium]
MKTFLILFFLLPVLGVSQNNYHYKNLVMEGGGVRGLAYSGALEVLENKGILKDIDRVAGSSAGAIAGLMVSLGYDSKEIDSILQTLKIQDFNDGKFFFSKIRRVKNEYGVYKGDKFENWLGNLIESKTGNADITFGEFHQLHLEDKGFKDFYCTGTNITQQRLEILSWKSWPQMELKTAVHISGCIPFYFKPVPIDSVGNEVLLTDTIANYDLYVDGGMLCNYPINMFDSCSDGTNPLTSENVIYNPQTLGLKLERGEQIEEFEKNNTAIAPYQIKNMKEYSSAVMNLVGESLNRKFPNLQNEKGRTIYISYGDISGRPRKISVEEKRILHDNGVAAADKFFSTPIIAN